MTSTKKLQRTTWDRGIRRWPKDVESGNTRSVGGETGQPRKEGISEKKPASK